MPYWNRRSPRLKEYDYSRNGYYFVTICAYEKRHYFSHIRWDDEQQMQIVQLTDIGRITQKRLLAIPERFHNVKIDKYVIMPNHLHAIIILESPADKSLSEIIGAFKSATSRDCILQYDVYPLFQKSFHEHIIRSQVDYSNIWLYIEANPARWNKDCFFSAELE